ncbi:methyl-accepting chemotaxis protein/methyl-accepting chemotaxis protein-1 (serine sensor receptor) [Granulicella aggregans]|uniref:Methyl-accepting chemotaxis protein/methyl-accepting chemotaxis protein-1 (Serine sensor receptor) n=1 Tax=Granulicella aggregans TaxID=474949 RepID=A0A7W7ZFZ3_9BACT|nr:methyl-accepting chemotaxis protein [Granulicella aggregans]MBB5059142.1 methyl-accepting chemotaxis protein/methyl-accepting chemotaxis protein-1 (serine sensor receptor) [Granulicella aggregans]
MTIGKKLYAGFGAAVLISLLMGIVAVYNLDSLGDKLKESAMVRSHNLYLSGDVNNTSTDILASIRGLNLRAHIKDMSEVQKNYGLLQDDLEHIRKQGEEFKSAAKTPKLRDDMQSKVLDKLGPLSQLITEDYQAATKGDLGAMDTVYVSKLNPAAKEISAAADQIAQDQYKVVVVSAEDAISSIAPARYLSIAFVLLAMGVGGAVAWVIKGINSTLQSSIVELNDGAEQVATAAGQVSSSSQSLAQGASQQAASLEETSASSEEINSMARKNTDNSRSTAELLAMSQEKVGQANRYLEEMVVSMDLITDSSGKISKIIKVIDEIAFQTNILALNAAVEAARAGEAGMGFAVVADEVRSLAQRSAQAAKDTAALIEDSITRSGEGKVKVDQVALAIRAVTEDAAKVKVMVDEVSLGSEEQSRGIDQIGRAITQMEQVTQTNAASAEESAAAAEQLSAQSETLKDVIGRLHEMVGGSVQAASFSSRGPRRPKVAPKLYRPPVTTAARSFKSDRPRGVSQSAKVSAVVTPSSAEPDPFPMEESFQSF